MRLPQSVPSGLLLSLVLSASSCQVLSRTGGTSELVNHSSSSVEASTRVAPPLRLASADDDEIDPKEWRTPGWRDRDLSDAYHTEGFFVGGKILSGQILGDLVTSLPEIGKR